MRERRGGEERGRVGVGVRRGRVGDGKEMEEEGKKEK